jgi:hypothetical protein
MLPTNVSPLNDRFIRVQIEEHQAEIRRSIAAGSAAPVSFPGRLVWLLHRLCRPAALRLSRRDAKEPLPAARHGSLT